MDRLYGRVALDAAVGRLSSASKEVVEPFSSGKPTPEMLELDPAEQLLFDLDHVLGDGAGRSIERASQEVFGKQLGPGSALVQPGNLFGTLTRLKNALERPFDGLSVEYEVSPTDLGSVVKGRVAGRPRTARLLKAMAAGAIRAAERYSHDSRVNRLKLYAELSGDRFQIDLLYRTISGELPAVETSSSDAPRSSRTPRPPATNLESEVERILRPPASNRPLKE